WQRPAELLAPNGDTLQQIWRMQSSLKSPTSSTNLGQRLYLTQQWVDLLAREGFDFLPDTGTTVKENLTPCLARQKINSALRNKAPSQACLLLDTYLEKLDQASRNWFADGSPGNILKDEWKPVTHVDNLEVKNTVLLMHCLAGKHKVDLQL